MYAHEIVKPGTECYENNAVPGFLCYVCKKSCQRQDFSISWLNIQLFSNIRKVDKQILIDANLNCGIK